MSYTSKYTGQEIDAKLDKIGEIGVLDNIVCNLPGDHINPSAGLLLPFQKLEGNMEVKDNKVVVKPGRSVAIIFTAGYHSGTGASAVNEAFDLVDYTNNVLIYNHMTPGVQISDYNQPHTYIGYYTNTTDADCLVGVKVNAVYRSAAISCYSTRLLVFEVGRYVCNPCHPDRNHNLCLSHHNLM